MMEERSLGAHLRGGVTSLCHLWLIECKDGDRIALTDHDCCLEFDGIEYEPQSGFVSSEVEHSSGLASDNAQAMGALSSERITAQDIAKGKYDGATLSQWLVNWQDVSQHQLMFQGFIGEITRTENSFTAELRGQSDLLDRHIGRSFTRNCDCHFGDARCAIARTDVRFEAPCNILEWTNDGVLVEMGVENAPTARPGDAIRVGQIDADILAVEEQEGGLFLLLKTVAELPKDGAAYIKPHCDKSLDCCHMRFGNVANFGGFPHIPGNDWLMRYPKPGKGGL